MFYDLPCTLPIGSVNITPYGNYISVDGTKMYMSCVSSDYIYQYTLGVAWDISTAIYLQKFYVKNNANFPVDIVFKSDGTKLYVFGMVTGKIFQYTLGVAWDISTAVYDEVSFNEMPFTGRTWYSNFYIKSDGTKLYNIWCNGYNDFIRQYTLGVAWDISTAVYDNKYSIIGGIGWAERNHVALFFKSDGLKVYLIGTDNNKIAEYTLTSAWNISTIVYSPTYHYIGDEDKTGRGIFIKSDGTKIYITGGENEIIFQYTLNTPWDISSIVWNNKYINVGEELSETYRDIACTLATNANNDNFYGRLIDCTLPITTILVDAIGGVVYVDETITITVGDVNIATDTITVTTDISTGTKIIFNSTGNLPSPLVIGTLYYAIRVDETHIQVATTLANANAGVAIDLTDVGTGVHTSTVYKVSDGMMQSIRLLVTIDGEDVSDALVGEISINHMKNACSIFLFYLNNFYWSPLINPHIRQNKVVVITAYINGYPKKLFTGLIDGTDTISYGINYKLNVYGRDYGKKLERKKMSLISVQDLASNKYRGSLVKYMAAQADITDVECPNGSYVRIDHSFHYQSILDMIVKELNIDTYWWRVDEEGQLKVALSEIKTDVGIYPTAEWDYGVDRFTRLGLKTGPDDYIINKLKVMGAIYDYMIEIPTEADGGDPIEDAPAGDFIWGISSGDNEEDQVIDNILYAFSNSWSGGDLITGSGIQNNVQMTVTRGGITQVDSIAPFGDGDYCAGPDRYIAAYRYYKIEFKGTNVKVSGINYSTNGYIKVTKSGTGAYSAVLHIKRRLTSLTIDSFGTVTNGTEMDGGLNIELLGKVIEHQDAADWIDVDPPTSAIIDNEEVAIPTYEYSSEQVSAEVTDPTSIAEYGERKPNNEGTLQFPLAENASQCEGIAKHIIRESHRFKFQPNFEIPFNPLFLPGHTVGLTDPQIGFAERYHAEAVTHLIIVDPEGKPKARTILGCVYYA